jgi:cell division protein FtsQ
MSATGASVRATRRPATAPVVNNIAPLFKRLTHAALVLVLLLGVAGASLRAHDYILAPANFPIVSVVVEGRFQYLDREAVRRTVMTVSRKGFFAMDVDALHGEIVAMPWVDSAVVQRVWPDGIALEIVEHRAVARWNADSLLTESGVVIVPPQLNNDSKSGSAWRAHFRNLPFLQGETGKPLVLWQRFVQASKALSGVGVTLYGIHNDRRHAVTLVLDNTMSVRLGRGRFDRRLNRFVAVYARYIAPQLSDVSYVDMRYPNGFASGRLTGRGS